MQTRVGLWPFVALFLAYLGLAAVVPVYEDELYYWCWSKDVQWSYYDHPPMVALVIRMSGMLFGNTILAIRIPACVASTIAVYVINCLTPSKFIVAGMALTLQFTFVAVLMIPDPLLLMFWAAYLWWLTDVHQQIAPLKTEDATGIEPTNNSDSPIADEKSPHVSNDNSKSPAGPCRSDQLGVSTRWWVFGGLILGCGILSKYTMGLVVPVAFVSLLLARRPWREWLPGYALHGVVAYLVASPILIYNIQHDFAPLQFQWEHISRSVSSGVDSFGYFVGSQILIFGLLPFLLLPWVCFNHRRLCQNPRLRACVCLYALPLMFFLYKATQSRLNENWGIVSYVAFWPLASEWCQSVRPTWWRHCLATISFAPSAIFALFIGLHLIIPMSFIPPRIDRIYQMIATSQAIHTIAERLREHDESLPVYACTYQMTSRLRFESFDAQQLTGISSRASHFTIDAHNLTDVSQAYVVSEYQLPTELCLGFKPPILLASVPVDVRGENHIILNVWLYSKK